MSAQVDTCHFELHFPSLSNQGHGLAFPCDVSGQVSLDALTECARCNYLYARALIGRDFAMPAVRRMLH